MIASKGCVAAVLLERCDTLDKVLDGHKVMILRLEICTCEAVVRVLL